MMAPGRVASLQVPWGHKAYKEILAPKGKSGFRDHKVTQGFKGHKVSRGKSALKAPKENREPKEIREHREKQDFKDLWELIRPYPDHKETQGHKDLKGRKGRWVLIQQ